MKPPVDTRSGKTGSALRTLTALFAPSDEQLMWRVQTQDDHAAFGALMKRWEEPIRHLCARLTGDPHRSEDLAQEVFSRLFASRASFRQGSKFSTYLWRCALNHTYSDLRRTRNRRETCLPENLDTDEGPQPSLGDFPGDEPTPHEAASRQETGEAVRRALTQLPEPYRAVLVLRHYQGLKFREIAEVLGLPEGTVKTRMTEALNELARLLRQPLDLKLASAPNRRTRPTEISLL